MRSVDVVIPVYNEEDCLPELERRMAALMDDNPAYAWQVLLVENGSTDRSAEIIEAIAARDPRFVPISLVRNFGTEGGILAGLAATQADAAVTMQADLEDPPELIPEMIRAWESGALYVYASVASRARQPLWRRAATGAYYRVASWASDGSIVKNASDFRLLDRHLYTLLNGIQEQNLFLRGLVTWAGFPSAAIPFSRGDRFAGETKFRFRSAAVFASLGILAQSTKPLRFITWTGVVLSILSVIALVVLTVGAFTSGVPFAGFGTIVGLQILFFGLTMVFLGLVSEYIALIYREVRPRPHFIRRPPTDPSDRGQVGTA